MDAPLWMAAASFAARAHEHQRRKDGRTPYFSHPARVALVCAAVFHCTDERLLAAAMLHDTIEDTGVDYDEILESFGREVADIVALLTKDMRLVEHEREEAYDRQLRNASGDAGWKARLIKLADVYDNALDLASDRSPKRMIEKARRALALAENDTQCRRACEIVRALVQSLQSGLT